MFHLHHLIFLPFFVLFHVVGFLFLAFAAVILTKAFRRRRCGSASRKMERSEATRPARFGNEAFDDYRRTTLRKLEAEAEEFRKYLDGLRRAADAAAFEAFLKSRRAENGPAA
ncbi:DUF2852 domain-containing protein [Hyphomicrobium sp. MC8b]|uniref:DUF2852 domain-containing protein n=1 Tax=Hyphomicrobium sp. MC8b TaxID=300273 RepID=UPI00391CA74C